MRFHNSGVQCAWITVCFFFGCLLTAWAQDIPQTDTPSSTSLPNCGRTCIANSLGQAELFGCSVDDTACLCSNQDFGFIIRDCAAEACSNADRSSVVDFASQICQDAIGNQSSDESGNQTSTATVTGTITTDETESTGSGRREASTGTTPPDTVDISSPTATSSAAASTTPPPEPVDKGLSNASKAGIGVGVVLGTAIICGICFLLFKRRRRQRRQQQQERRRDPEPERERSALEPPPAYPYGKTAHAQGVAGPTFSTPQNSRSQVTEHELEGNPDRNDREIDSNPLYEAPFNVPEASIIELGTSTTTGGGGPSVPPGPLGRGLSHKSDTYDLTKLEQEERQLQEEIVRLEKLERLKSERDQVRQKIKDLHQQQQQSGRASTSLSTPVDYRNG